MVVLRVLFCCGRKAATREGQNRWRSVHLRVAIDWLISFLQNYTDWTNASNGAMRIENIQARAALMPSKPDSPPLFLFFSIVEWCPAHTLPTLSTPASTRPSNEEAAGSRSSSATPGWVSAAVWPSPKGAPVRWGRVESPRLCCWGRAKWVRWEGTLLGDGSSACPPSIEGVMQLPRDDITPTEARWARRVTKDTSCVGLLSGHRALEVLKVSPTRRRWCRLELRCIVQVATWLVCGYAIQRSSCGRDGGNSLGFFVSAVTIRSSPR